MRGAGARLLIALAAVACAAAAVAAQGTMPQGSAMPNPREMSGIPLPSGELPRGSVTVRVIRGSLSNPIPNQPVDLTVGATVTARTNDAGRAEFAGLAPGVRVKAVTVVAGERLESQEFAVPPAGGIRVMLVATDPDVAAREAEDRTLAAGPARPGIVVLGDQSRFVFEIGDEGLNVFNILEIQNTARTPVEPRVPLVFDLPADAERAAILEGSSPLAAVAGKRVTVNGPFPPGPTVVQFAYTVPYSGSAVTVTQRLPAALAQVTVIAQKVGDLRIASPQLAQQRDMAAEGQQYVVGQGAPLAAGSELTVAFAGLPSAPVWPRNLALVLACVILAGGAVAAVRGPASRGAEAERARLEAERERLFSELTAVEGSHRAGTIDPQEYAERRRDLVLRLERVYAALDEQVAA